MKVKFKKLNDKAVLPFYGTEGAAGLDITATSKSYDEYGNVVYGTGLAMEIPKGYVCLIFPRSSNSKKDLSLSNSVGILDEDFRGELSFKFKPALQAYKEWNGFNMEDEEDTYRHIGVIPDYPNEYYVGERVGQLLIIPYPKIEPEWADELSETQRGTGSYGSTGN